jgi:hypothetical protein
MIVRATECDLQGPKTSSLARPFTCTWQCKSVAALPKPLLGWRHRDVTSKYTQLILSPGCRSYKSIFSRCIMILWGSLQQTSDVLGTRLWLSDYRHRENISLGSRCDERTDEVNHSRYSQIVCHKFSRNLHVSLDHKMTKRGSLSIDGRREAYFRQTQYPTQVSPEALSRSNNVLTWWYCIWIPFSFLSELVPADSRYKTHQWSFISWYINEFAMNIFY